MPPTSVIAKWQTRLHRQHRPRLVAVGIGVLALLASTPDFLQQHDHAARHHAWWMFALGLIACGALFFGRRRPREAAVVCLACAAAQATLGSLLEPLILGPSLIALYLLASRTDAQTTWTVTGAGIVILVTTTLVAGPSWSSIELRTVSVAAWLLLPTALGIASRMHLAYLDAAHARAADAERTREEEARHRVLEERLRIARELHDVVAHHLALANAQAGTVAHLLDTHPDETDPHQLRRLADQLTTTTSAALRELKHTVGLLRESGKPEDPVDPAPGLGQLDTLTASFQPTGLTVSITIDGDAFPLPPIIDLTAYRIIQEALTNATKHAAAIRADVRLAYTRDHIQVTITNPITTPPPPPGPSTTSGYGLIGMTERADSVGGRLHAGGCETDTWQVRAELPLNPQEANLSLTP